MKPNKPEQVELDVLRVASLEVLGQTKPLSVSVPAPFCLSNAKGDLKTVDSWSEIAKMAADSATSFKANICAGR